MYVFLSQFYHSAEPSNVSVRQHSQSIGRRSFNSSSSPHSTPHQTISGASSSRQTQGNIKLINLLFYRQSFLESTFPSTHLVPSNSAINAASKDNEKELDREQKTSEIYESKLSKRNTFAKFALDQTFGAGVNTLIFLIGFGGLSGKTWDQSIQSVRDDFWGLIFAGWKLWPLVSFFNFAVIKSVEIRGLVGSLAGLGWGIYLSLKNS